MTTACSTAQQIFDERYITSTEIMETLGVTRTTILLARRTGKLPEPISVKGMMYIWERERVQEYIRAWKLVLDTRRGATA